MVSDIMCGSLENFKFQQNVGLWLPYCRNTLQITRKYNIRLKQQYVWKSEHLKSCKLWNMCAPMMLKVGNVILGISKNKKLNLETLQNERLELCKCEQSEMLFFEIWEIGSLPFWTFATYPHSHIAI